MQRKSYQAHAPGSLMLLGEYAVLHDKPALVCAIDKRISVTLTARTDNRINISSILGNFSTHLSELHIAKPFQFVLGTLLHYQAKLKHGYDINIASQFSDKVGFASSAAVTVATLAALTKSLGINLTPLAFVRHGRSIIRHIQGMGSGADIAASVYGGVVKYQAHPLRIEKYAIELPLHAIYSGFKTTTVDAVSQVSQRFSAYPDLFRALCRSIEQCTKQGAQFLNREDWNKLGEIMNAQQGLMESLGVSSPLLQNIILDLRKQPKILGAKISGSGLGDCVIGLGELPEHYQCVNIGLNMQRIPMQMTRQGVYCEQI